MFLNNISYEKSLWEKGLQIIAGADEVGRGAIAGPIVTAAVSWDFQKLNKILEDQNITEIYKINDSKKLSEKNRALLSEFIIKNANQFSIVEIDNNEIDKNGVGKANKKALEKACQNIKNLEYALIDYFKINLEIPVLSITKGDQKSLSIASASIIAKVYRDNLMKEKYHKIYPQYGFDKNVGYGTKAHMQAIKTFGLTPIHRKSYNLVL